ncbi:hypothetical protein ABK040_000430 [Willaertia magna]
MKRLGRNIYNLFNSSWEFYSYSLIHYPLTTKGLTCGILTVSGDFFTQHKQTLQKTQNNNLQEIQQQQLKHSHSFSRSLKLFLYGTFLLGPSLHYWFKYLDKLFPVVKVKELQQNILQNHHPRHWTRSFSKERLKWSAKRVIAEQISYAIFVTGMYFVTLTTLDYIWDHEKTSFENNIEEVTLFCEDRGLAIVVDNVEEEKSESKTNSDAVVVIEKKEVKRKWSEMLKERFMNEFKSQHENGMKFLPIANFINFLVVPPLYRGFFVNVVGFFWNAGQWAKEHF